MKTLRDILEEVLSTKNYRNNITFLTGAGLSAASGIPTYRGTDGIWIKGSTVHRPEEFGTFEYFSRHPEHVWHFTLFRKGMFEAVQPNSSHELLVEIEGQLKDKFHIITQNIDNLHLRAGTSEDRIYEIHGNSRTVRCAAECSKDIYPFPEVVPYKKLDEEVTNEEMDRLKCPKCNSVLRPNILWFDEYYNERLFKLQSALKKAKNSGVLIAIGTSGATTLPQRLVNQTIKYGGYVIDVNLEDNELTELIKDKKRGVSYRGTSEAFLQEINDIVKEMV